MRKLVVVWAIALVAGISCHLLGYEGLIRVFVTDSESWEIAGYSTGQAAWVGNVGAAQTSSALSGGARPQTTEIIKTVNERCPEVIVTMVPARANFILRLEHEGGKGVLRKDNKVALFNSAGDLVFSSSTRLLGNAVKDACGAIQRWVDSHGIPATAASLVEQRTERAAEGEGEDPEAETRSQGDPQGISRPSRQDDTPPAIVRIGWGDEEPSADEPEAQADPVADAETEEESPQVLSKLAAPADKPQPPPAAPAPAAAAKSDPTPSSVPKGPATDETELEEKEKQAWLYGLIALVLAGLALGSLSFCGYAAFRRSWGDVAFSLGALGIVAVIFWVVFYQPDFKALLAEVGSLVDSGGKRIEREEPQESPRGDAAVSHSPEESAGRGAIRLVGSLLRRGIDGRSVRVADLRSVKNPKGEGVFVFVPKERFHPRLYVWLVLDQQAYALNGPAKSAAPSLKLSREASDAIWGKTGLDRFVASEALKIVFGE